MLAITFPTILKMIVIKYYFLNILADIDIEYLRINVEDTSDVPIKLSFPVAYSYLENAFNECKLLNRDKSKRNNALVDDKLMTSK